MERVRSIVYIASPFGFSEAGRLFYQEILLPLVRSLGFEVRDPWSLTPQQAINAVIALPYGEKKKFAWRKLNRIIGRNNVRAIHESDLVLAVLDGTDVDSGTASEIGFAAALGKNIIGYRGDFRLSSDNEGSTVNLQVEYFILQSGWDIATSIESLKETLEQYMKDLEKFQSG